MTLKLYCFGESGNAYKVALTLALSGIEWEPVFVDFFHGETRSPEFRAINAMGEAPVLIDGDKTLTQSNLIQLYLSEKYGKFGGENEEEQREILRWMLYDCHKVSGQVGPLRFNMNFLPEAKRNQGAIDWLAMRSASALKVLNAELSRRDWIAAPRPTIADFALCGYLYYPEPFTFDRADYPAIDAWMERISALPGWKHPYDLMPGSPADRA